MSWRVSPSPRAVVAAALLVAAAAGCSAPAAPLELVRAEAHERDGQDAEALAAYEEAVGTCRQLRDRDRDRRARFCTAALHGRAATLDRLGRREEAAEAWEAAADELAELRPEAAARALLEAGRLRLALGQDARAWALLWKVVTHHPDADLADEALRILVRDGRRRNARQLDAVLAELDEPLGETGVGDNLLYARADLHERELGDPAGALALFDRLAARYPTSALRDEALWRGAALARAQGDPGGAVRRLETLLRTREESWFVGSYHSVWLDDAQLEVGRILRDDLARPRDALQAFARIERHYPASVLIDDALFETAVTHDRLGDGAAACKALLALARRFPESRYELEAAPALRERLRCKLPSR